MLKKINSILINHIGKKNSITAAKIALMLGIVEDDTHAQTRALIFECAKMYRLPLAADNTGYYLIETDEEFYSYLENLDSRIRGIEERKQIITQNYRRK